MEGTTVTKTRFTVRGCHATNKLDLQNFHQCGTQLPQIIQHEYQCGMHALVDIRTDEHKCAVEEGQVTCHDVNDLSPSPFSHPDELDLERCLSPSSISHDLEVAGVTHLISDSQKIIIVLIKFRGNDQWCMYITVKIELARIETPMTEIARS